MNKEDIRMERKDLEYILKNGQFQKGGTKEACVKAREFIRNSMNPGNQLHAPLSCVTADEFVEAVKTLMAFAYLQDDTIPEAWECDKDCKMTSDILCPGEFNIRKGSDKMCPYFMDEGFI